MQAVIAAFIPGGVLQYLRVEFLTPSPTGTGKIKIVSSAL
jgi:hypothetical protein